MPRVLATVDEQQKTWVESQSDSLDVSEAEVIRRLIDATRRDESLLNQSGESLLNQSGESLLNQSGESVVNHESVGESDLIQRVADLEARVDDLEAGDPEHTLDTPVGGGDAPTGDAEADSAPSDAAAGDVVMAALDGWSHGRGESEREASTEIARRATVWLRDRAPDAAKRADAPLEDLADADPLDRTPDTLWTQVIRDAWQYGDDQGYIEQPNSRAYSWTGL